MIVSGDDILKYIPQRKPFVFIDKLFQAEKETTISGFHIKEDNPLIDDGFLSENGLIENIAQTAAAGVGYDCVTNDKPVQLGFIGAVKKLQIKELPKINDEIITTVRVISEVMNASIIHGQVELKGEIIAECDLNIFIQNKQ